MPQLSKQEIHDLAEEIADSLFDDISTDAEGEPKLIKRVWEEIVKRMEARIQEL